MAVFNPSQFVREVRQEMAKVTWPSRKEALVTTAMVFAMLFVAAIFFALVDVLLSQGVGWLLGLKG